MKVTSLRYLDAKFHHSSPKIKKKSQKYQRTVGYPSTSWASCLWCRDAAELWLWGDIASPYGVFNCTLNIVYAIWFDLMCAHFTVFFPHDAMHWRGICHPTVSLWVSVTFVYCVDPQTFFTIRYSHIILVLTFSMPNLMAIFRQSLLLLEAILTNCL